MWFGTNRGGVNKYNAKSFTQMLEKRLFSITEDKFKNIWIGTIEEGLIKLIPNASKTRWDKTEHFDP